MSLFSPRGIVHMTCEIIGGVLVAGVFAWYLFRAIAATGALDRFGTGAFAVCPRTGLNCGPTDYESAALTD